MSGDYQIAPDAESRRLAAQTGPAPFLPGQLTRRPSSGGWSPCSWSW